MVKPATDREHAIMVATLDLMDAFGVVIERHFRVGDGYDGSAASAVVSTFAALQVAIERAHVRDLDLANADEVCAEKVAAFLAGFHASLAASDEHLASSQAKETRAERRAARDLAVRVAAREKGGSA